jgi:hypothetical protein
VGIRIFPLHIDEYQLIRIIFGRLAEASFAPAALKSNREASPMPLCLLSMEAVCCELVLANFTDKGKSTGNFIFHRPDLWLFREVPGEPLTVPQV